VAAVEILLSRVLYSHSFHLLSVNGLLCRRSFRRRSRIRADYFTRPASPNWWAAEKRCAFFAFARAMDGRFAIAPSAEPQRRLLNLGTAENGNTKVGNQRFGFLKSFEVSLTGLIS